MQGDISSNGCEEDHQCHSHEFCFLETHSCAPCYNCASYNRKPSEGKSCSKEPLDCGQCMEGLVNNFNSMIKYSFSQTSINVNNFIFSVICIYFRKAILMTYFNLKN